EGGGVGGDGGVGGGRGRLEGGRRRLFARDRGVQVLLRDRLLLDERTVARHVRAILAEIGFRLFQARLGAIDDGGVLRADQIRFGLGELSIGGLERSLVLVLLYHEQGLVLLHLGPFTEPHLLE